MVKQYEAKQRHEDYRFSLIALPVLNLGRDEHKLLKAEDIFPSLKPKVQPMTPEMQVAAMRAWERMGYGTVITKQAA
jgi:hypothetical protein